MINKCQLINDKYKDEHPLIQPLDDGGTEREETPAASPIRAKTTF